MKKTKLTTKKLLKRIKTYMVYTFIFIFSCIISNTVWAQCSCTSSISSSTSNSLTVSNGQTVCITGGTFSGNLDIASGGKVCISAGATCNPANMNTFAGTVENRGTFTPQQSFSFSTGAVINNYGTFNLTKNLNFNGAASINTFIGGTTNITVDFNLNNNSTFNNGGVVIQSGGGNNFSTSSNTTLINDGEMRITNGNFNPSGIATNNGMIYTSGQININSGSTVYNKCRFIAILGFNNNSSTFTNDGLIWVTSANPADAHIQNNGGATFTNGPNAQVRGLRFTNSGTVKGEGAFYFTETTKQQGTFFGTNASNLLRFYDATIIAPATIWDFNSASSNANVMRPSSMTPPDTLLWGNCTNANYQTLVTRRGVLLDIKLSEFAATPVKCGTVITWKKESQISDVKTWLQKSNDGSNFTDASIAILDNAQFRQTLQLNDLPKGEYYFRLKTIDVAGYVDYSAIIKTSINCQDFVYNIYPNPATNFIYIKKPTDEKCEIRISNVFGQILVNQKTGSSLVEKINLPALPKGLYHVSIIRNNKIEYSTIISN